MTLASALRECRKRAILEALERCNYNQCHAAKELGVHRTTLVMWVKKLEIPTVAKIRN